MLFRFKMSLLLAKHFWQYSDDSIKDPDYDPEQDPAATKD